MQSHGIDGHNVLSITVNTTIWYDTTYRTNLIIKPFIYETLRQTNQAEKLARGGIGGQTPMTFQQESLYFILARFQNNDIKPQQRVK